MNLLGPLLASRRLVVSTALLLAMAGALSWGTMPREEDPQFPSRDGLVTVIFPGADAETVERLIIEPLEEHLAEVSEIGEVYSTARAGVAVVNVELRDTIYATDAAWDEVEDAIQSATPDFPTGASPPMLDDDLVVQEAVVLAVVGSRDPLVLADAAEHVKRHLLRVEGVREVKTIGDPEEQITVAYDGATARRLGVDPRQLGQQLAQRSTIVPGGAIRLGDRTASLRPQTEFGSVEEIATTPILLPSGAAVPLASFAEVWRGPRDPATELARYRGEIAVALGVVPQYDLDRVALGDAIREALAELAPRVAPLRIEEVIFQPDMVEDRLRGLGRSLMLGMLIVALVLFLAMGPRLGLLVVVVVPLVTFSSLAAFAAGGGILHQISIAALVIALGMLVDNAIVVAEGIQYRIDRGAARRQAAIDTVRELALPLGTATGTTVAAFIPMLLSKGPTADFTRAIPTLIILTLVVSYLFAVLVTPVLAQLLLRPRPQRDAQAGLASRIARLAVRRPGLVMLGAAVLLLLVMLSATGLDRQFFPLGDRAMLVVDVELPEGSHLTATSTAAARLETLLADHPEVDAVASFVGRSAPRFYYNLTGRFSSPQLAQLTVETTSLAAVDRVIEWIREVAARELPEAEVVARRLQQGPPIDAPVELRVSGEDLGDLERVSAEIIAALRSVPGTRDVRRNLGLGVANVEATIDDAAAARHGVARTDVALALLGRTLGTEIGQYRVGEDPIPIVVRSHAGEQFAADDLATIDVATPGGVPVPLDQVARLSVSWRPAAIHHRDGRREVRILSELAPGVAFTAILDELEPMLAAIEPPDGVRWSIAGEATESNQANVAILRALPLGTLLLLFFLLVEFNSFRRIGIILMTVPLAAVGVVPGLLISGQPFGFMSLLGVFSLIGIVVNNAIVLIDRIETQRAEGHNIDDALRDAVIRRTRPILLTMATTVAGLLPLALSDTSLWPPLAWAMISGLLASTVLTLLVIPALYKLIFDRGRGDWARGRGRRIVATATLLAAALTFAVRPAEARPAEARTELTLADAMRQAAGQPAVTAAARDADMARLGAEATSRGGRWPTVGVVGDLILRDRVFELVTPFGPFDLGEREGGSVAVEVVQPLWDRARRNWQPEAAKRDAAAASQQHDRRLDSAMGEAAHRYLDVLAVDAARLASEAFAASLRARVDESQARADAGRVLETEVLKLRLELESAELDLRDLDRRREVAAFDLGRALGRETPVSPVGGEPGSTDARVVPTWEEAVARAVASRADLAALETVVEARDLEARAVRATRLPSLEARATWTGSEGDPLLPESLFQGGLRITWAPFAAGTRAPRHAAARAERDAAAARSEVARQAIGVEIRDALARLATARDAVPVRARGVELATETLRVERERYAAGRATANDLLDAEASLRRQRTAHGVAQIDVVRAWVVLDLAIGDLSPFLGNEVDAAAARREGVNAE